MSDLLPFLQPWSGRVLVLLGAVLGLWIVWRAWRRKPLDAPHCPACGYNLTGIASDACPECGYEPRPQDDLFRRAGHKRMILLGLVVAFGLPTGVVIHRINEYGWGYYLRLQPLYTLFGQEHVRTQHLGPFTVTQYRDRRNSFDGWWAKISPGDIRTLQDVRPYAWGDAFGGQDLNGNGRPNLIMASHEGGNTDSYRVYELIDGRAQLIFQQTGSPCWIDDADGDGIHEFIGDLERQPGTERWVRQKLEAGAQPVAIDPPGGG